MRAVIVVALFPVIIIGFASRILWKGMIAGWEIGDAILEYIGRPE